jgi:tRNA U38,U39,U40 pseudouridine synthase TruA
MQRWKLTIEYDGTPYMGWQRQHHGPSVQQTIEDALTKFTEISDPCLNVAGRTDAGVHAVGQVAHIDIEKPLTAREMQNATNHHMGYAPIAILKAEAVDNSFHARFDAKKRYYRYRITCNHQAPPKLDAMRSWHIRNDLISRPCVPARCIYWATMIFQASALPSASPTSRSGQLMIFLSVNLPTRSAPDDRSVLMLRLNPFYITRFVTLRAV